MAGIHSPQRLDNACRRCPAFTLMPKRGRLLTVEFKTTLLATARGERFHTITEPPGARSPRQPLQASASDQEASVVASPQASDDAGEHEQAGHPGWGGHEAGPRRAARAAGSRRR